MPALNIADIRNVVLLGHGGAGKTILAEAMLHKAGMTTRFGTIEGGTTVCDFEDEEKQRGHSVAIAAAYVDYNSKRINLIDSPGYPDFIGAALAAIPAAETALVVISAAAGIEVNTRRLFAAAGEAQLARIIVINKIDAENLDLPRLLSAITESFGNKCRPLNLPADGGKRVVDCLTGSAGEVDLLGVEQVHTELLEAVVETDEAMMERYLSGEEIGVEELRSALAKAVAQGSLIPIVFTSAREGVGVQELMDYIIEITPSPADAPRKILLTETDGQRQEGPIEPDPAGPAMAYVLKTYPDPRSGIRYTVFRVLSGRFSGDSSFVLGAEGKTRRVGHLLKPQGKDVVEIDQVGPGEIAAVGKLDGAKVGQLLHPPGLSGALKGPAMPEPMFSLAIEPKSRGDEEKISAALSEMADEDPTFRVERDPQTKELVISGVGDLHVRVALSRMHRRRGLEVTTKLPKIPYRETITGTAKYVEYTHKKQTGGAGQFARVYIDLEPNERGKGYEFIDKIFGGAIDQPFRGSVDKGIRQQMAEGVLAGFPVVDVKVSLVDGKTHPVDSKDIAFQIAGREVFKKAFMAAKPILLEPIVAMEISVPAEYVGDITGDLAARRGRIVGQEMLPGNIAVIRAQVPLAEVAQYNSQLKSVTGGQGSYTMEFYSYEPVPSNIQQAVVAAAQKQRQQQREK